MKFIRSAIFFTVMMVTCHAAAAAGASAGGDMHNYLLGRFSFELPAAFAREAGGATVDGVDIEELSANGSDIKRYQEKVWNEHLTEIKEEEPPPGHDDVIAEIREVELGKERSLKALWYYTDFAADDSGAWHALLRTPSGLVWLGQDDDSDQKENIWNKILQLAKAYRLPSSTYYSSLTPSGQPDWYYLKDGALAHPFELSEESYTRFDDAGRSVQFEIEMDTTLADVDDEGLLARFSSMVVSGFANLFGGGIAKIRAGHRTVAGLPGEEVIMKVSSEDETKLSFTWSYKGERASGQHPQIILTMTAPQSDVEGSIQLWDELLERIHPLAADAGHS